MIQSRYIINQIIGSIPARGDILIYRILNISVVFFVITSFFFTYFFISRNSRTLTKGDLKLKRTIITTFIIIVIIIYGHLRFTCKIIYFWDVIGASYPGTNEIIGSILRLSGISALLGIISYNILFIIKALLKNTKKDDP